MYKIYQEMDVFLIASVEDGTPNPGLEAAACGRPIISNPIGNMPELIKDGVNGFLVKRQIGAYVEKIRWLQKNRDKMIKMGLKNREEIEKHWTWKIQAERYRNMFREIFVRKMDEKED
jgi:glycosyltransferase involved in cell wall biosynthesis